jgi:rhodanese-related sulfurtransferase
VSKGAAYGVPAKTPARSKRTRHSPKPKSYMNKLLTLLSILALSMSALAADVFPDISHKELKTAIAAKTVTLLDAAGSASYGSGHIPGALDFQMVTGDLATKLPADKGALIVAYCANENCPFYKRAASAAKALGYTNVKHYVKGIAGWRAAGETVEK